MSFYIYENWQAGPHKAAIHVGNCGFCNYGKGRGGGYDPRHAKWHPHYQQLPAARAAAASLPVVVVKLCRCVRGRIAG
ncbi:MAG: hypothetical protein WB763_10450 [Terriglobia bacterium]|jgi:hypothetical protein